MKHTKNSKNSTTTTMVGSTTTTKAPNKEVEIIRLLATPTVDLWKLRALALSEGGLLNGKAISSFPEVHPHALTNATNLLAPPYVLTYLILLAQIPFDNVPGLSWLACILPQKSPPFNPLTAVTWRRVWTWKRLNATWRAVRGIYSREINGPNASKWKANATAAWPS